jgi:DNA-binding transcriptional ArsR family regulator
MTVATTAPSYKTRATYFKALAHPVRLQILELLRGGEACVCHIETALNLRQTYISQQLMILRQADVVVSRKVGLQVYYRLADGITAEMLQLAFGESPQREMLPQCPCPQCEAST